VYVIIAAVLLVGLVLSIGYGIASARFTSLLNRSLSSSLATITIDEFCTGEETQQYSNTYALLSSNLQQQYPESQFTLDSEQHDSMLGQISTCMQQGPVVSSSSTEVTVNLTVTRMLIPTPDASGNAPAPQTSNYSGQISLVNEAGQWKVDQVDSSLNML